MERMRGKVAAALVAAAEGSGSAPTAAELARIQPYALEALSADELYVRQVRLANDAVDRTWERLPRDYLERFAATLPGKPLLLGHDHQETPTGLWFQAEVRPAAAGEPKQLQYPYRSQDQRERNHLRPLQQRQEHPHTR